MNEMSVCVVNCYNVQVLRTYIIIIVRPENMDKDQDRRFALIIWILDFCQEYIHNN